MLFDQLHINGSDSNSKRGHIELHLTDMRSQLSTKHIEHSFHCNRYRGHRHLKLYGLRCATTLTSVYKAMRISSPGRYCRRNCTNAPLHSLQTIPSTLCTDTKVLRPSQNFSYDHTSYMQTHRAPYSWSHRRGASD